MGNNKPWLNGSGCPDPTAYTAMKNIQKERRLKMTALDYMKKQLQKHRSNYERESARGVPKDVLHNIELKIGYYETAINALKKVGDE